MAASRPRQQPAHPHQLCGAIVGHGLGTRLLRHLFRTTHPRWLAAEAHLRRDRRLRHARRIDDRGRSVRYRPARPHLLADDVRRAGVGRAGRVARMATAQRLPVAVRAQLGIADGDAGRPFALQPQSARLEFLDRQFDAVGDEHRDTDGQHRHRLPHPRAQSRTRRSRAAGGDLARAGRYRSVDRPAQSPRLPVAGDRRARAAHADAVRHRPFQTGQRYDRP